VNLLLVPVWVIVAFICIHALGNYSDVANLTLLALIMLFSLWAWWYGEDRDRRQAGAKLERTDEDGRPQRLGDRDGR
jgi:hypothetical protein